MAGSTKDGELKNTGYELFILLLSLVSVANMVLFWINFLFKLDSPNLGVLNIINAMLTAFFLFDFFYRLLTASSKSQYFVRNRGWADLLACIPQLRIFRLFRILRAVHLLRAFGAKRLVSEVVNDRAGSALYLTVFSIILIAEVVGVLILRAESRSPDANITDAGDAVWWILVTMTTVGYGDEYPVTAVGRMLAVFVMFSGVALIGVLASFLSNFFIAPPKPTAQAAPVTDPQAKIAELRSLLGQQQEAHAALATKITELEQMM